MMGALLRALLALVALAAMLAQPASASGGSVALGEEVSLDGRVALLVDPTRALSFAEVLAADERFRPIRGYGVNLGYTRDAAWLRIRLDGVAPGTWLLSLTPNFVDLVDVYVAGGPQIRHLEMGDHRPLPQDALSGLDNVVPLELEAGRTALVYVRIASVNSALNIAASLYSAARHTSRVTLGSLAAGVWLGGMLVLLAIQLVFFQFHRRPQYPLLAFSIAGAMLVYMGNLGISATLFFPRAGIGNDLFTATAVWLGLTASSLAATSILELRRALPWMHRIFLAGAAAGLIGVGFAFAGANLVFGPFGSVLILVLATLAMGLGFWRIDRDDMGSRLRAAAYAILWLGLIGTVSQRSGFWPLPDWIAHSYAVACLLQTLLLTGALAVRLRQAEALGAAKTLAEDALHAELRFQRQQVRFMEVISHQYRTPLATIRSNVDSIGLSLPQEDAANRGRIERVRRGIVRLVEMLEVNLARSRLQGPSFTPEPIRIGPCEIALAAVARARDLVDGDIGSELCPEAGRAQIVADPEMLEIAVINLIENAVKYSGPAGGNRVTVSCRIEGGSALLAVADRGIGIPAEEIEGITERFARGSNARSIEGSGMGLSLVSRIAAAHEGTVEIRRRPGGGTLVGLRLPLLAG